MSYVRFKLDNQQHRARNYYGVTELPGGGSVERGEIPDDIYDAADKQVLNGKQAKRGGWLIVWDGNTKVVDYGQAPSSEGRFSGGDTARLGILNWGLTANQSYSVQPVRSGGWRTFVDGEVAEESEFRPHTVWWESQAAQGGFAEGGFQFGNNGGWL